MSDPVKNQRDLCIMYKQTFGDQVGKIILEDLQKRFARIGGMSKDANESFFKEGQRSVMQWILWQVTTPIEELDKEIEVQL